MDNRLVKQNFRQWLRHLSTNLLYWYWGRFHIAIIYDILLMAVHIFSHL